MPGISTSDDRVDRVVEASRGPVSIVAPRQGDLPPWPPDHHLGADLASSRDAHPPRPGCGSLSSDGPSHEGRHRRPDAQRARVVDGVELRCSDRPGDLGMASSLAVVTEHHRQLGELGVQATLAGTATWRSPRPAPPGITGGRGGRHRAFSDDRAAHMKSHALESGSARRRHRPPVGRRVRRGRRPPRTSRAPRAPTAWSGSTPALHPVDQLVEGCDWAASSGGRSASPPPPDPALAARRRIPVERASSTASAMEKTRGMVAGDGPQAAQRRHQPGRPGRCHRGREPGGARR